MRVGYGLVRLGGQHKMPMPVQLPNTALPPHHNNTLGNEQYSLYSDIYVFVYKMYVYTTQYV